MLGKLGFRLTEIMEKYVLLDSRTFKKIETPKVLSWDAYADPEKNIVTITRNRIRFKHLTKEDKRRLIRIALRPRSISRVRRPKRNDIATKRND
ncbi:MAG: hypothetical protein WBE34_10140, partial [Candidatus Nitrosopolaris sp.]